MNINEFIKKLSQININKKMRIYAMLIYAVVMFAAIQSELNIFIFILLFAIAPIGIYLYVKAIFPKEK